MKKNFIHTSWLLLLALLLSFSCNRNDSPRERGGEKAPDTRASSKDAPDPAPLSGQIPQEQKEAAEGSLRQAALDGMTGQVKELLNSGVNPGATDQDGVTALMLSAFNGHSDIVLELLSRGAVVDRTDRMGRTALLYAATGPFPETVKILIDKGADPNIADSGEHFTPLMHAAAEGNLDVVKILLESGADPALTDLDNDDAETFARQAGHLEVAELLHTLR